MSFTPTAVLSVELSARTREVKVPAGYRRAHVLIRYRGAPLCHHLVNPAQGKIGRAELWSAAWVRAGRKLGELVLRDAMGADAHTSAAEPPLPRATIIVCTRNRTEDLRRCLDSIVPQLSDDVQALIIDNNPSDDSTKELVARYPVGYYREDRPGLNWARARGARLANTELLLYTDDDVVLDRDWAKQIRLPFHDPQVAAVTGAVVPRELEHASQQLYEEYGALNRGYDARDFDLRNTVPVAAGRAGVGASMALRRRLVLEMELFDCELDCGTASQSGGDTYAFYLLLRAGYRISYRPEALGWHRHRQNKVDLERMLYGYGVGLYCFWLRCLDKHHDVDALLIGLNYFVRHHLRELCRALLKRPNALPVALVWAEIRGVLHAPFAYRKVLRRERHLGSLIGTATV